MHKCIMHDSNDLMVVQLLSGCCCCCCRLRWKLWCTGFISAHSFALSALSINHLAVASGNPTGNREKDHLLENYFAANPKVCAGQWTQQFSDAVFNSELNSPDFEVAFPSLFLCISLTSKSSFCSFRALVHSAIHRQALTALFTVHT